MVRRPTLPAPEGLNLQRRTPLLDLDIAVVTPLFGGGTDPRVPDHDRPVTGKAVRGHLRFWWRACNANRYSSSRKLFEAERAIWGSIGESNEDQVPSPVDVSVKVEDSGTEIECVTWERRGKPRSDGRSPWRPEWGSYPGYGLFPFQGEPEHDQEPRMWKTRPAKALEGVRFKLRISRASFPDVRSEPSLERGIEDALWAWLMFGGIGARTRRGCGSLHCEKAMLRGCKDVTTRFVAHQAPPADAHPEQWKNAGPLWLNSVDHVGVGARTLLVPVLSGATIVVGGVMNDAIGAWTTAVSLMRDFRQKPGLARQDRGESRPGQSFWPEADSIRDQWEDLDPKHKPIHKQLPSYPRTDLGLPIGMQQLGTWPFPVLEAAGDGATRMASPVILKALPLPGRGFVPIVVLLNAPNVWDQDAPRVVLKHRQKVVRLHKSVLTAGAKPLQPDPDGRFAQGQTIRKAFLEFATDELSATEVVL